MDRNGAYCKGHHNIDGMTTEQPMNLKNTYINRPMTTAVTKPKYKVRASGMFY